MKASFAAIRDSYLPAVEEFLSTFLSVSKAENGRLSPEMTAYHLETGGKRLRAMIPLYVYSVMGRNPAEAAEEK